MSTTEFPSVDVEELSKEARDQLDQHAYEVIQFHFLE